MSTLFFFFLRVLKQEICTLSKKVKFSLELRVEKGRGYVTSEENSSTSSDVDFISMDSVFTPIINVKYSIENTRVEQKTENFITFRMRHKESYEY